ncbi:hypothetical protein RvVAR031_08480 [Agrobacterium vitis]|nr:hypothetical protein RvVAR031_08480 [Agrobacterium vitis]
MELGVSAMRLEAVKFRLTLTNSTFAEANSGERARRRFCVCRFALQANEILLQSPKHAYGTDHYCRVPGERHDFRMRDA